MKKTAIVLLVVFLFILWFGVWLTPTPPAVLVNPAQRIPFERVSRDGTAIMHYRRNEVGWNYSIFVYGYDNNEPIYTIKNIGFVSYFRNFFVSDDMMYLVHLDGDDIIFYAYGTVVSRVPRWRFIENNAGERNALFTLWKINWEFVALDSQALEITIETDEGRTVIFDMTSGEILYGEVRRHNIYTNFVALYAVISVSAVLVVGAVVASQMKGKDA